jgi:hypothetical protein
VTPYLPSTRVGGLCLNLGDGVTGMLLYNPAALARLTLKWSRLCW